MIDSRLRPSDGMPRITSWVCGVRIRGAHDKCLTDREERSVRGLELDLTVSAYRCVARGIGLEAARVAGRGRGRGRRATAPRGARARGAPWRGRCAPSGAVERRARGRSSTSASTWHHCAERAAPPTNTISCDRLAGERLDVREQPREVVRDALDDRADEVGAAGVERHVHEAAADRAARDRARSEPPSHGRNITPPAPRLGRARARRRAARTRRRRGGRRARRSRTRCVRARARAPCRRARSPRTRRSGRRTGPGIERIWCSRSVRKSATASTSTLVVPIARPGPPVGERAGRDRDRGGVVRRRVHDDAVAGSPSSLGDVGQQRADRVVDAHERRQARGVDARRAARARRRTRSRRACGCRSTAP